MSFGDEVAAEIARELFWKVVALFAVVAAVSYTFGYFWGRR